jgi:hypothetical protein
MDREKMDRGGGGAQKWIDKIQDKRTWRERRWSESEHGRWGRRGAGKEVPHEGSEGSKVK